MRFERRRSQAASRPALLASLARLLHLLAGGAIAVAIAPAVSAQAPVPLPNTISTVAGGATASGSTITGGVLPAKGAACFAGSPYTATDAYGDGCPGLNTAFSSDFRGGLQVDGLGNVFIMDTTNSLLRKLDARSGLVTAVTGTSITGCTTSSDAYGDGCPSPQTKLGTARGVSVDAYGNVLIAGYGMQTINIVCNAVSPLCPNTANHKQVGSMYRVAGCISSATATGTTGTGTTNGTSGDGYAASPYGNLSGDVADWGTGSTAFGSCTAAATLGAVSSPRGVAADRYGNVYIAETGTTGDGYRYRVVVGPASFTLPNGTVLTNPLASIIALDPAYATITPATAYGKIYPILGGFTQAATGVTPPTTLGAACAGPSGGAILDTIGDGCPFYESTSGTGQQGVGVDALGNVIFSDNSKGYVRVLFTESSVLSGATTSSRMAAAIRAANANPTLAVLQGYVYPIAGPVNPNAAVVNLGATPTLGTATTLTTGLSKVAVDAAGDIYLADFNTAAVVFFDITTGYIRRLAIPGSVCPTPLDSVGDGCPINSSNYGGGASGMGIGISPEGDLYLADNTNALIRKVTATNLVGLPKGGTVTQNEIFHGAPGTIGLTAAFLNPSTEIAAGTVTCSALNPDSTLDCTLPVTFTPAAPGLRDNAIAATATGTGGSSVFPASGIATAAALVGDSTLPVTATVGSVTTPSALAVDGQDNLFVADTGAHAFKKITAAGTTSSLAGTLPATPFQLAVDPTGNVFATSAGASSITRETPSQSGVYSSSTFTFIPTRTSSTAATVTPSTYGIVADRQGNLFVADRTTESVYEIPATNLQATSADPSNQNPAVLVASGFSTVGELALDGSGNLFIADNGAGKVFRLLAGAATPTAFASSVNPTHIAADNAGDLYVEDATAKTVTEYPVSGLASALVYTAPAAPSGLAITSSGSAYVSLSATITSVQRNRPTLNFGTTNGIANYLTGQLTNTGNAPSTGTTITAATGSKFIFDSTGTSTCGTIPSPSNTLLAGGACSYTVYFNPATSNSTVSATLTELPGTAIGALTLTGIEPAGTTFATSVTISGPTSAVYVTSGATATYTVKVTATGTTDVPTGTVTATSDCATGSGSYTLTAGSVTIPLTGCTAGMHTLTVAYPNTGDGSTPNAAFGNSVGSIVTVVAQAPTTLTWTPGVTTRQYSAAVGLGVLNATAKSNGTAIPGTVVYTATNAANVTTNIHSASFLPIGIYTLNATFYPTDAVDLATSTASVASFTVTKASTTAAVGATQNLVAADGSGNFTSVQSALNTLPATGGSVYIKPGTYTGNVTVVQPNVALRGLGGDPSQVILTHSGGAFGSTGVYAYAGEFTSAQNNGAQLPPGSSLFSGDEGSATLVVAPGINSAVSTTTLTPNGFYGENLTLANTYDTAATTTSTYVAGSTCTANAGPAETYSYLYNNGLLCASQALAIWTTADLSVMNNVYTTSLQDTIYAGSQGAGSNGYVPARQYWFRGKVTGDVDYIFGDAAAVFDYSSIFTTLHGTTATGTETIEAQNKMRQTGSSGDYLSGYVMNSNVFTSYEPGMTSLYFGRPYGPYSTWIMLNSYIDQVAPSGYIEFSGDSNLPTSTYDEFNDIVYTDPATGALDANGVLYTGLGGSTGQGVTGTRETTSTSPGTAMAANSVKTSMTQVEAQAYFPTNFLSAAVPNTISGTTSWIPTDAIAAGVNSFANGGANIVAIGSGVTILMRPQTPGLGAITNGNYTIPTGTYILTDTYNGATSTLASGTLDASGEAYFTTRSLGAGAHNLSWTYSGDTNFAGSTTPSAYTVTVTGYPTTTMLAVATSPITYGQSATVKATVASAVSTPAGTVTLTVDGASTLTGTLSNGTATFTVPFLAVGTHTFTASYLGSTSLAASNTTSSVSVIVSPAAPVITVNSASITYGTASTTLAASISYGGTAAPTGVFSFLVNGSATGVGTVTCFGTSPVTCSAPYSPTSLNAGTYTITANEAADSNYGAASATGTLTIGQTAETLSVSPVSAPYGSASETLSANVIFTGSSVPTGAVSFIVNGSATGVGTATCAGATSPLICSARFTNPSLAGGSYTITAAAAPSTDFAAASATGALTIAPVAPALKVNAVSIVYGAASTQLSTTVAFTGPAVPSGAVSFSVNGSASGVGTVVCTGAASPLTCTATYSSSTLISGSYLVTASVAADTNYTAAADSATFLVSAAPDFSFTNSGAIYQAVVPGASTTFTFALAPLYNSYPGPVAFSVMGLPANATYSLTPSTVPATGSPQSVVLTVYTAEIAAANHPAPIPWKQGAGLAFAAALLPLCLRRRQPARLLLVLLYAGSLGTLALLIGCAVGNGYLVQAPTNNTVIVTATSGPVQHSASVTLNLQ